MRICRTGITRTVVLVGTIAIKFPTLRYGYQKFLEGLLANLQERFWWREWPNDRLCPVLLASRWGFWLVMPFVEDIEEHEMPPRREFTDLPLDYKADNFGRMDDGRIVLRDYG